MMIAWILKKRGEYDKLEMLVCGCFFKFVLSHLVPHVLPSPICYPTSALSHMFVKGMIVSVLGVLVLNLCHAYRGLYTR